MEPCTAVELRSLKQNPATIQQVISLFATSQVNEMKRPSKSWVSVPYPDLCWRQQRHPLHYSRPGSSEDLFSLSARRWFHFPALWSIVKQTIANWTSPAHLPKRSPPPCQNSVLLPKVSWRRWHCCHSWESPLPSPCIPPRAIAPTSFPVPAGLSQAELWSLKLSSQLLPVLPCKFNVWAERGLSLLT